MAIPESEPKKTEESVSSARQNGSKKGFLLPVKNLTSNESTVKSFTPRNSSIYDLYKNIKGFSFYMPGGWNDRDLNIFIQACKDNIELLQDCEGNKSWEEIAKAGQSKSDKPFLFTVNSCLEVAQRIKSFVENNVESLGNYNVFKRFSEDIIQLLPYFPNQKINMDKDRTFVLKDLENYFQTDSVKSTLSDLIIKRVNNFQVGRSVPNMFDKLSNEFNQVAGLKQNIKEFLTSDKVSKIFHSIAIEDPTYRKEYFYRCGSNGFTEIFNCIEPSRTKKEHLLINKNIKLESEKFLNNVFPNLFLKRTLDNYPSSSDMMLPQIFYREQRKTYMEEIIPNIKNTVKQAKNFEIDSSTKNENNHSKCEIEAAHNEDSFTDEQKDAKELIDNFSLPKIQRKRKLQRPGTRLLPKRGAKLLTEKVDVQSNRGNMVVEPEKSKVEVIPSTSRGEVETNATKIEVYANKDKIGVEPKTDRVEIKPKNGKAEVEPKKGQEKVETNSDTVVVKPKVGKVVVKPKKGHVEVEPNTAKVEFKHKKGKFEVESSTDILVDKPYPDKVVVKPKRGKVDEEPYANKVEFESNNSKKEVEHNTANALVKHKNSMMCIESNLAQVGVGPNSSKGEVETNTDILQDKPNTAKLVVKPKKDNVEVETNNDNEVVENNTCEGQIELNTTKGKVAPNIRKVPVKYKKGRVEVDPKPGEEAIVPSTCKATIQPITGQVEFKPKKGIVEIEPNTGKVEVEPNSSNGMVNIDKVKDKPTKDKVDIELNNGKVEDEPNSCNAEVESKKGKIEVQPSTSKVDVKPSTSKVDVKPSTSKIDVKPSTSKVDVKPSTSKVDVKPSTSKVDVKPSTSKGFVEPSLEKAEDEPNTRFIGFEEVDDESLSGDEHRIKRYRKTVTVKRTVTKTSIRISDTDTDDSDSDFSTCPPSLPNYNSKGKTFNINEYLDHRNLNMQPVVKLKRLNIYDYEEFKRKRPRRDTPSPSLDSDESSTPTEYYSPTESAVLAQDVVDSVYNPRMDSARVTTDSKFRTPTQNSRKTNDQFLYNLHDSDSSDDESLAQQAEVQCEHLEEVSMRCQYPGTSSKQQQAECSSRHQYSGSSSRQQYSVSSSRQRYSESSFRKQFSETTSRKLHPESGSIQQYLETNSKQYAETSSRQYLETSSRQHLETNSRQCLETSSRQYMETNAIQQNPCGSHHQHQDASARHPDPSAERPFPGPSVKRIHPDRDRKTYRVPNGRDSPPDPDAMHQQVRADEGNSGGIMYPVRARQIFRGPNARVLSPDSRAKHQQLGLKFGVSGEPGDMPDRPRLSQMYRVPPGGLRESIGFRHSSYFRQGDLLYDGNSNRPSTSNNQPQVPRPESALAIFEHPNPLDEHRYHHDEYPDNVECSVLDKIAIIHRRVMLEVRDHEPSWFAACLAELQDHQQFTINEYKKIQQKIMYAENKKVRLIKKVLEKLN